ncbi:putative mRNA guanylyltransferase [Tuber brumale]|nr:putative mRNA guanylyltransferase [Tuber brumale]
MPSRPSSVPSMPGIKADHDLAQMLRSEIAEMLGRGRNLNFPGAQPISFARKHLDELKREDYYLCEKSDGIRCLLYFTYDGDQEVHYLIDRKNDYYFVPHLHFPLPDDPTFRGYHRETLVDGELVLDDVGGPEPLLRYLIFDCLILDNRHVMNRTLDKRLAYFREYVYNPYKNLIRKFPQALDDFPFQVEFKKMEFSYAIRMMFQDVLPNLPHGNDGLIFTCRTSPYRFGTDQNIIKWKPAEENSIDFRLNLEFPLISREDLEDEDDDESDTDSMAPDYDAMPKFNLSVFMGEGRYQKWAEMYVTPQEWDEFKSMGKPLDEEIVECAMDDQNRWRFLRLRTDKKEGNHISTVNSVIESIRDRVGKEDLMGAAKEIRDAWKARLPKQQQR